MYTFATIIPPAASCVWPHPLSSCQVFEGAAYASSDGRLSRASLASSSRQNASPPPGAGGSLDHRAWVPVRTESSPPLGLENSLASGSELGASETSDWDQVCVYLLWVFYLG